MDDEPEVHRDVGRQDESEPSGRIQQVTAHAGDERHAAEDLRVPQGHVAEPLPPLGGPGAVRVAGRVLVVVHGGEERTAEHRERHERDPEDETRGRGQCRVAGLEHDRRGTALRRVPGRSWLGFLSWHRG